MPLASELDEKLKLQQRLQLSCLVMFHFDSKIPGE